MLNKLKQLVVLFKQNLSFLSFGQKQYLIK
ncbi:hypothetical protein S091751_1940 [Staphylococcus aureus subsp. aureus 091751]|nr:hypothetical protein S091751_1940 [Staphylococcus aureus subsp. aureus 091751]